MLSDTIKSARKSKGLSQQELAEKLNVTRQTISKWEQNLSVPDSDLLLALSEALDVPVSALLGQTEWPAKADALSAIAEKLEVLNLQLARQKQRRIRFLHLLFLSLCGILILGFVILFVGKSPYLGWNLEDPETAVAATLLHGLEWLFVRIAPILLPCCIVGAVLTRERR